MVIKTQGLALEIRVGRFTGNKFWFYGLALLHSTIFQLYHGGQFYW